MYNTSFTIAKCVAYHSIQEEESRKMVKRISASPIDWLVQVHAWVIGVHIYSYETNLNSYTTAVVLRIGYGIEITSKNDQYVEIAAGISEALSNGGSTGSTMVDVFPLSKFLLPERTRNVDMSVVRNLPQWASFIPSLKFARYHATNTRKMHALPYEQVKKDVVCSSQRLRLRGRS
jgi:hypothetical protein